MKQSVTKSAKKLPDSAVAGAAPAAVVLFKTLAKSLAKKIGASIKPGVKGKTDPLAPGKAAPPKLGAKVAAKAGAKVVAKAGAKPRSKALQALGPELNPELNPKLVSALASKRAAENASMPVPALPNKVVPAGGQKKVQSRIGPEREGVGVKPAAPRAATKVASKADTGAVARVVAKLADKIEKSVASKVSEVMTKTTKPSPAAHSEGRIITEDEIRQMSEKDYMNPAQLAFFKARLQQLEKDLLKNAGETTEHLRETVLVPDPADRATIEEEHALELRTRDRERKLLKKIQQSIGSIDAGDYGWCEETGEPIGIPRLIARPTATLSLEAQQRRELKQKLYGD